MRLAAPREVSTIGFIPLEILMQLRYRGLTRIAPITLFLHVGQEADGHRGPSPHTGFAELLTSAHLDRLPSFQDVKMCKNLSQKSPHFARTFATSQPLWRGDRGENRVCPRIDGGPKPGQPTCAASASGLSAHLPRT